ncbi:lysozyme C-1 [Nilaparvata lugens]|uniref:lysozyme C-1 n=1 Tax=Nilaparvata lugens TaxID=108931 RepID=UPI00193CD844|nr:lysozyme C-1 [Nilaparvata lugens]
MYAGSLGRIALCITALWIFPAVLGKVYNRCELAKELRTKHKASEKQLATWVCIARHESEFNTTAYGHTQSDHGLFQISGRYWCSEDEAGDSAINACGLSCDSLKDDDIGDDFVCARRIYRQHQKLSGNGFNAWVVYRPHCADGKATKYLEGCFP